MGNDTFTLTKSYGDGEFWTEAIMDAIKSEVEAQFNTVNKNNFDQLKADLMPNGYTYDDDGNGNLTNALYDKQVATDFHEVNISLGTTTDGSYTDVDATNAALVFTPELAGNYLVTFQFSWEAIPTAAAVLDADVQFRLTDSAASPNVSYGKVVGFTSQTADESIIQSVTLQHVFNFTATLQTVKLEKRITTAANIGTHVIKGSAGQYGLYMTAIKI